MGAWQRNKGKAGEREFAAVLTLATGFTWQRTQQCRGDKTSDIAAEGLPVHVEVKRMKSGLTPITNALVRAMAAGRPGLMAMRGGGHLSVCLPEDLARQLANPRHPDDCALLPRSSVLERAFRQACRDAEDGHSVLVGARQDAGMWLCAWHAGDHGRLNHYLMVGQE